MGSCKWRLRGDPLLQLRLYAELVEKDIALFDSHKTGELTKCVEERVSKLAGLVESFTRGLPSVVSVPFTLHKMWQTSPELTKANGPHPINHIYI